MTVVGVEQLRVDRFLMSARPGSGRRDDAGDDVASAVLVVRLTGIRRTVALLGGLAWRPALLNNP